jgi:hypothetical protein
MKIKMIVCLLFLPLIVFSQDLGIKIPENKFIEMNKKALKTELALTNIKTGFCYFAAAGGATVVVGGTIISLGGIFNMTKSILEFTVYPLRVFDALYYGGIIFGGSAIAGLGVLVFDIALKSINKLDDTRQDIKIILHQFEPTSYNDHPGIGVGVSISLNNR